MIRRLFAIASGVSLLLCIASVVLWVRGFWVAEDVWHLSHTYRTYEGDRIPDSELKTELTDEGGHLVLRRYHHRADEFGLGIHDPREGFGRWTHPPHQVRMGAMIRGIGMRWTHWEHAFIAFSWATYPNGDNLYVHVPWLYIVALLLLSPVAQIAAIVRRRRRLARRGRFCETCGYNLMGNISGVCPECGAAIVKATERVA